MSSNHSETHPSLQKHSVGEFYPWSIVGRAPQTGELRCYQPIHLITGERGPEFLKKNVCTITAHAAAEKWIEARVRIDKDNQEAATAVEKLSVGKYVDGMRELSDLATELGKDEYTFLIPTRRDSDQCYHAPHLYDWLGQFLLAEFGGYSQSGHTVGGHWKDDTGNVVSDSSHEYYVATNDYDQLLAIILECKVRFDQQCIYVAKTATNVQLV